MQSRGFILGALLGTVVAMGGNVWGQSLRLPPLPSIGVNDTISHPMTIFDDEWVLYERLPEVRVTKTMSREQYRKFLRMYNAVYKVYPYMKEMGRIILETRRHLDSLKTKQEKDRYMRVREKELLKAFTKPMTKLSRYQGSVLIRLVNRETGTNCYDLLKEYKGAFTTNVWQALAVLFGNSLKQEYRPDEVVEDRQIEQWVSELENATIYP